MRQSSEDRLQMALNRAAAARAEKEGPRRKRSILLETVFGASAAMLGLLAVAAHNLNTTSELVERAAVAFLNQPPLGVDMQTTASISPPRLTQASGPEQSRQAVPETLGQGDRPVSARIHINMGEDTLRGSL